MHTSHIEKKYWQVAVIGAGQAGLSTGYYLKKAGVDFIILDENEHAGDSWRKRWDSLALFTPAQHDGLPGMPFPAKRGSFPTKEEVADYFEKYIQTFSLPVKSGVKVNQLNFVNEVFQLQTTAGEIEAEKIVVATGTHPYPYIPAFARGLSMKIHQLHSANYKNPESLPDGDVLVVGAGTSGLEIAIEVAKTHKTYISGNPTFHIPDRLLKYGGELYWWLINNLLTIKTPVGRKARQKILHSGGPLIRVSVKDLHVAGVELVPRVKGVHNGLPELEDDRTLQVTTIIWSTGYKPDFSWIKMNLTLEDRWPLTNRGVSIDNDKLFFVGLPFQFGLTSGLIGGTGRDAYYISKLLSRTSQKPVENVVQAEAV